MLLNQLLVLFLSQLSGVVESAAGVVELAFNAVFESAAGVIESPVDVVESAAGVYESASGNIHPFDELPMGQKDWSCYKNVPTFKRAVTRLHTCLPFSIQAYRCLHLWPTVPCILFCLHALKKWW